MVWFGKDNQTIHLQSTEPCPALDISRDPGTASLGNLDQGLPTLPGKDLGFIPNDLGFIIPALLFPVKSI